MPIEFLLNRTGTIGAMTTTNEIPNLTRVVKPESTRELGPVDISEIKPLILGLPENLWDVEDARKANRFDCFHHTRHIVFRFITGNRDPRVFETYPIWDVWSSRLIPLFDRIVDPYGLGEPVYPKAMLARLAAGHVIDRHIDGAGSNLYTHKIHVPIRTNAGALFTSNGQTAHLKEGVAYEANNIAPHEVENRGDTDRIHLVFEVFDGAQ